MNNQWEKIEHPHYETWEYVTDIRKIALQYFPISKQYIVWSYNLTGEHEELEYKEEYLKAESHNEAKTKAIEGLLDKYKRKAEYAYQYYQDLVSDLQSNMEQC